MQKECECLQSGSIAREPSRLTKFVPKYLPVQGLWRSSSKVGASSLRRSFAVHRRAMVRSTRDFSSRSEG